jgi:3'-phosphoadenosine 5'-phosphosulfate sulfotransferase (PAPS reductase)/FAD synthetase
VLGISGGKDSAALAIYIKDNYPDIHEKIEYYTSDTGRELDETYRLIDRLENYLGKKILRLTGVMNEDMGLTPFDFFLRSYGGYLPSTNARWCTKKLKLDPFEKFVGSDPVISYVGIRGDEEREGYISKKNTIQSIFPFRKNIWSEDVINKILNNSNIDFLIKYFESIETKIDKVRFIEILKTPISKSYSQTTKLNALLEIGTKEFNKLVNQYNKYQVNGKLTLGENIADLGGIKFAMLGLEIYFKINKMEITKKHYQEFFKNYANILAANVRENKAKNLLLIGSKFVRYQFSLNDVFNL